MKKDTWWIAAVFLGVFGLPVGFGVISYRTNPHLSGARLERFEREAGVQRLSCINGMLDDWAQCDGLLQGHAVRYRCTVERCHWVLGEDFSL